MITRNPYIKNVFVLPLQQIHTILPHIREETSTSSPSTQICCLSWNLWIHYIKIVSVISKTSCIYCILLKTKYERYFNDSSLNKNFNFRIFRYMFLDLRISIVWFTYNKHGISNLEFLDIFFEIIIKFIIPILGITDNKHFNWALVCEVAKFILN